MNPTFPEEIRTRLAAALKKADVAAPGGFAPAVTATGESKFGDYQSNAAMLLAKELRANPRELAAGILLNLDIDDLCEKPEIAGPGFMNFRVREDVLSRRLHALLGDERLGVPEAARVKTIVIDFSAPNVAKPMHVGHIRGTIIGDSLTRIARFLGHRVFTDNHIGDWGTQFGMIIYGWKNLLDRQALEKDAIAELLRIYKEVNEVARTDESVLDACRAELLKLQQGDAANLAIWKECVDLSIEQLQRIYTKLDIHFDHFLGESFYNDRLAPLVDNLLTKGVARESEGAICVFFEDVEGLEDKPFLVRKADGGFLYSTTDLATVDYRIETWNPDEIWYVVGAPQQLHFRQLFEVCRRRGTETRLIHVQYGSILGGDRKLMKTRSGENVQLGDVLDEAVERARAVVEAKNPLLSDEEKQGIAEIIGVGAVKYAELSQGRMTDYVFSWDKMLSMQGNTAPYLQNAYVRIRSIFRKLDGQADFGDRAEIVEPAERALALKLLQFGETVPEVLADYRPNILANYLYELADTFHGFYESCNVLRAECVTRATRLTLCELTARVLRQGLALLGIKTPERM